MIVLVIVGVCIVLLILGFLLPRLSIWPQRGVDRTLGSGQRAAGGSESARVDSGSGCRSRSHSPAVPRTAVLARVDALAESPRSSSAANTGISLSAMLAVAIPLQLLRDWLYFLPGNANPPSGSRRVVWPGWWHCQAR
jgi:hypothetical protein